jgi:hypothetical protein
MATAELIEDHPGTIVFPLPVPVLAARGGNLRDWFAGLAMQGFAAAGGYDNFRHLAQDAYRLADSMLDER